MEYPLDNSITTIYCHTKQFKLQSGRVPFVPSTKTTLKFTQITNHEQ